LAINYPTAPFTSGVDTKEKYIMKVMILSSFAAANFYFREDMIKAIVDKGHEVVVGAPEPAEDWKDRFLEIGAKYVSVSHLEKNGINPFKDTLAFFSLLDLIRKERPDKIFAYHAKTIVYGTVAASILGVKDIYIFFGGLGSVINGNGNGLISKILRLQYKAAIKRSRKVFLQNEDDIKKLLSLKLVKEEQIVRINGSGVNLEKFQKKPLPEDFTFLFVGRIIRDKGVLEYINAAKEVKTIYPNIRVQIIGYFDTNPSAITLDDLKPYIEDGTIEYLGYHEDVRPFLEKCTVFVLPSYHEGTPKSVLEAMAIGRPIITTDTVGCRETVINGLNGFLVPVKDSNALADRMIWMIENPEQLSEMAKESRKLCEQKFDVRKVNEVILSTMGLYT